MSRDEGLRFSRSGETRGRWLLRASLVVAGLAVLATVTPVSAASSTWTSDPTSWSNGLVLCNFASSAPSVSVSHSGTAGTGMTVTLGNLTELAPDGSVVAFAKIQGMTWVVGNWSTSDAYDEAYSAHAPLATPTGVPAGSTDLVTQFILPAYQGSPDGPTDSVNVVFTVANWSWHGADDRLALTFAISPTFPGVEHLNATGAPGWLLASTSNASGSVLERMGADTTARVTQANGSSATVSAGESLSLVSPAEATIATVFGNSAGQFSSLMFTSRVGIVLPATVAGIPIGELAAAGAAGAAVSVLVAVGVRRVRRRPSDLIYVSEEEKP